MNKNILTFNEWALIGKDEGMEIGHAASVSHMLKLIFKKYKQENFSVIDLGCGNGWVVRKMKENPLCELACGIDGSKAMIDKAIKNDPGGLYINEDLSIWKPQEKYDVVFSMETLYYFQSPIKILNKIYDSILKETGILIMGIDHYSENIESLNWGETFNLDITTLSIEEWCLLIESAGFNNIKYQQVEKKKNWLGTLIISAEKK